jgi:hypothetical protein
MAITFDGPSKIIQLDGAVQESIQNIYSRWVDWFATGTNSRFLPAFRTIGDPGGIEGYNIPVIAFLLNGWLIRPLAGVYELRLTGGILVGPGGTSGFVPTDSLRVISSQPVEAFAYDINGTTGPTSAQIAAAVRANLETGQPVPVDVVEVDGADITGTVVLPTDIDAIAAEVRDNLSSGTPISVSVDRINEVAVTRTGIPAAQKATRRFRRERI